jgi:hypothetical protein
VRAAAGDRTGLFDGYGTRPPWPERQAAMVARCRELTAFATPEPGLVRLWQDRTARTRAWTE